MGSNGSGKSTLLLILDLILSPSMGDLFLFGKDVKNLIKREDARKDIAFIFQNPSSSMINKTCIDEVMFSLLNYGEDEKTAKERALNEMERFGIFGFEKRDVSTLSSGQKQRLSLASAFVNRPKILLLDEAFSYLDKDAKKLLEKAIDEERLKGSSVISVTHDVKIARLSDRILLLKQGKLIADGESDKILKNVDLLIDSDVRPLDEHLYFWRLYGKA